MTRSFLMTPWIIRPSRSRRSEDDLTLRLKDIGKVNEQCLTYRTNNPVLADLSILQDVDADGNEIEQEIDPKCEKIRSKNCHVPKSLEMLFELQRVVAGFTDSRLNPKYDMDFSRQKRCVRDTFNSSANGLSHGLMRGSIMRKRSDFTGRAPAAGDSDMDIDCIGIPMSMCMNLLQQDVVTLYNFQLMLQLVLRGNHYPGAVAVIADGVMYEVPGFAGDGLKVGHIVVHHLLKGALSDH